MSAQAAVGQYNIEFICHTIQAGLTEINLGELAEERANDPRVKEFGKQMIQDHTQANESLKNLAVQEGIRVPAACDAEHRAVINKIAKIPRQNFDLMYMEQMITDHKKVIASLQAETKDGNSDLKEWAKKTLPTVEEHLKMAEDIDKELSDKEYKGL